MRNIAVIGDLRRHLFYSTVREHHTSITSQLPTVYRRQPTVAEVYTCDLIGGAVLDASAIAASLKCVHPEPHLITYSPGELQPTRSTHDLLWPGFSYKQEDARRSLRLAWPHPFHQFISNELRPLRFPSALARQLAEHYGATKTDAPVIDLLVINDLDLGLRALPLLEPKRFVQSFGNCLTTHSGGEALFTPECSKWLNDKMKPIVRDLDASLNNKSADLKPIYTRLFTAISECPNEFGSMQVTSFFQRQDPAEYEYRKLSSSMLRIIYGFSLFQLLALLQEFSEPDDRAPVLRRLWPLVIINVDSELPPAEVSTPPTSDEIPSSSETITLWQLLSRSPSLASRTIVVLDAEFLRQSGIPLSSGLSWEQCAQDLVASLSASQPLARCTRFGHLIVRFGISGAFYASSVHNAQRIFRIYFNPTCDDLFEQPTPDKSNFVLGYSSVLTACLVQNITRTCNRNAKDPAAALHLTDAIDVACLDAIKKCNVLYHFGYGGSWEDFMGRAVPDNADEPQSIPRGLMLPEGLFSHPVRILLDDEECYYNIRGGLPAVPIGMADVDGSNNPDWSIATSPVWANKPRPDLFELATKIVRDGIDVTFNQPSTRAADAYDALSALYAMRNTQHPTAVDVTTLRRACSAIDAKLNERPLQTEYKKDGLSAEKAKSIIPEKVERAVAFSQWIADLQQPNALTRNLGIRGAAIQCWFADLPEKVKNLPEKLAEDVLSSYREEEGALNACFTGEWEVLPFLYNAAGFEQLFTSDEVICPLPFERLGRPPKTNQRDERVVIIDRKELEGIRFVRNLIVDHLRDALKDDKPRKPLSLGVFGPPGSGKSTAVRSVIEGLPEIGNNVDWIRVNLAELTRPDQLESEFGRVTNAMAQKKIPIVFFDEFDCEFESRSLGWLKFFLAPMEDGEFKGKNVGNAIFVFAGGTSSTFADFARIRKGSPNEEGLRFVESKGTDFVSRLRGHLDIVGINRSAQRGRDDIYIIRRAVVLRSLLEQIQVVPKEGPALIDQYVLRAMLLVSEYKHGARSLKNMLQLFAGRRAGIARSSLPPRSQIDMHVNGDEFLRELGR